MITNHSAFCRMFYDATGIPIRYYNIPEKHGEAFPSILNNEDIFRMSVEGYSNLKFNPDYFVSSSFSYHGFTMDEKNDIILLLGPIYSTPVSDATVHAFMHEWSIHPDHTDEIRYLLRSIPTITFNRFLQHLAYLHFCLTDECVDIWSHFHMQEPAVAQKISDKISTIHADTC